jgi:hypothetical protein
MRASLSLLVLLTFVLGAAFVSSAIAQPAGDEAAAVETVPIVPALPAAAEAEEAPATTPAPEKPADQAKGIFDSVKGGEWVLAFGFLAMLLGSVGRWLFGMKWAFIKTKAGGYVIAASTGLGVLGVGIVESGSFSFGLVPIAATAMFAAMGIHTPAQAVTQKLKKAPVATEA